MILYEVALMFLVVNIFIGLLIGDLEKLCELGLGAFLVLPWLLLEVNPGVLYWLVHYILCLVGAYSAFMAKTKRVLKRNQRRLSYD